MTRPRARAANLPAANRSISLLVVMALSVSLVADQASDSAAARALYNAALAAYEGKRYPEYLSTLQRAAELRPTHPRILYRLAGAYALNAQPSQAAAVLQTLASLNVYDDVAADTDFAGVRDDRSVRAAMTALEALRDRRIGSSTVAWTIRDPLLVPEGITWDPISHVFFVSSQYERKIVRIDSAGRVQDFVSAGQDGLSMVFGMGVDAKRRLLWAVSTADPSMRQVTPADDTRTGVFAFELPTGRLVRRIMLDPTTPAHYLDDLTVGADGRVFVSDAGAAEVYTVAPGGDRLDVLVKPETIQAPQGLAVTPDGRRLYVSDYAGFIFAIDPATGSTTRLGPPPGTTMYGIDGLARYQNSLIGIQNGVNPHRVVRLTLSADGSSITGVEILEMNHPRFHEPTLGVVVGNTYYYVANSHGSLLRKPGTALSEKPFTDPVILKLKLEDVRASG